jgi:hypothetical protein
VWWSLHDMIVVSSLGGFERPWCQLAVAGGVRPGVLFLEFVHNGSGAVAR